MLNCFKCLSFKFEEKRPKSCHLDSTSHLKVGLLNSTSAPLVTSSNKKNNKNSDITEFLSSGAKPKPDTTDLDSLSMKYSLSSASQSNTALKNQSNTALDSQLSTASKSQSNTAPDSQSSTAWNTKSNTALNSQSSDECQSINKEVLKEIPCNDGNSENKDSGKDTGRALIEEPEGGASSNTSSQSSPWSVEDYFQKKISGNNQQYCYTFFWH